MLSQKQIENNKIRFIDLVKTISREGFNKDLLLSHLENSDWYVAPASTKYHNSFKGGLVQHTLNVYDNLCKLILMKDMKIDEDSVKIVSLFHDLSKKNFYEIYYKNQKVYSESGSKYDTGGRYDWMQLADYKVRDSENRFIYGNHEINSEFLIRQYCPLTLEESIAILHHHGGMSEDSIKFNVTSIYNRFPLAVLLHVADMLSAYVDESTEMILSINELQEK